MRVQPDNWAYPRSRGATGVDKALEEVTLGLSPLARGNRAQIQDSIVRPGPIPARAGQPHLPRRPLLRAGAYPRSRGATLPANTFLP